MPKKKRIWYPGAMFHVMSRGNRGTAIFKDDSDYVDFLVYRLDRAVTATQKDILQAFNLTAASVKKEATELGKQLSHLTKGEKQWRDTR